MRLIYVGSPKKSFMWDRPLRMCESARSFRPSRLILSVYAKAEGGRRYVKANIYYLVSIHLLIRKYLTVNYH